MPFSRPESSRNCGAFRELVLLEHGTIEMNITVAILVTEKRCANRLPGCPTIERHHSSILALCRSRPPRHWHAAHQIGRGKLNSPTAGMG